MDVRKLAELARIRLDESEAESLRQDLEEILRHVEALEGAPVPEDGAVTEGPGDVGPEPRTREEGSGGPDPLRRRPEAFAPDWRQGFFAVPRLAALGDRGDDGEAGRAPDGETR